MRVALVWIHSATASTVSFSLLLLGIGIWGGVSSTLTLNLNGSLSLGTNEDSVAESLRSGGLANANGLRLEEACLVDAAGGGVGILLFNFFSSLESGGPSVDGSLSCSRGGCAALRFSAFSHGLLSSWVKSWSCSSCPILNG